MNVVRAVLYLQSTKTKIPHREEEFDQLPPFLSALMITSKLRVF